MRAVYAPAHALHDAQRKWGFANLDAGSEHEKESALTFYEFFL